MGKDKDHSSKDKRGSRWHASVKSLLGVSRNKERAGPSSKRPLSSERTVFDSQSVIPPGSGIAIQSGEKTSVPDVASSTKGDPMSHKDISARTLQSDDVVMLDAAQAAASDNITIPLFEDQYLVSSSQPVADETRAPTISSPLHVSSDESTTTDDIVMISRSEAMNIDQPTTSAMLEASQSDVAAGRQAVVDHVLENSRAVQVELDLVKSMKGTYRILDLVVEQGSGGLVDKIIICQDALGCFINDILPGAYASMTKVDFKALDQLPIKPLGIYGSRKEIVRFLLYIGAVDDHIARTLQSSPSDSSNGASPGLRSGLYILRPPANSLVYVIYWPEDTTWNDDAISSVQRNRVTFMRYLTKIADQVVALISQEDASKLVFNNSTRETRAVVDDDEVDRLFTFEVAKTNEQEENVSARLGFTLELHGVGKRQPLEDCPVDPQVLVPSLVAGETVAGYMHVEYIPPQQRSDVFHQGYTTYHLRQFLGTHSFVLSDTLSEEALQLLLEHGLGERRSADAVRELLESRKVAEANYQEMRKAAEDECRKYLEEKRLILIKALQHAIVTSVLSKFSSVDITTLRLFPQEQDVEELDSFLSTLFAAHPNIKERLSAVSRERAFSKISKKAYTTKKESLLMAECLLKEKPDLTEEEQRKLVEKVFEEQPAAGRFQGVGSIVKSAVDTMTASAFGSLSVFTPSTSSMVHYPTSADFKGAKTKATQVDDAEFLSRLQDMVATFPLLADAAADVIGLAQEYFMELLNQKVHKVVALAEDLQVQQCKKQVNSSIDIERQNHWVQSRHKFLASVQDAYCIVGEKVITIKNASSSKSQMTGQGYNFQDWYHLEGSLQDHIDPSLTYRVHPFKLTEHDKHMLQMDSNSTFIPIPRLHAGSAFSFNIPLSCHLLHIQLLQDERCLVIIERNMEILIYLDRTDSIGNAVRNSRFLKKLHREKIGNDFLLAFDETKRMLAVCATDKSSLTVFVFDERFASLQALGSQVDLRVWYNSQSLLVHVLFLCGASEELVLVDDGGHMRVYSLTTEQFRPTSLDLVSLPISVHSSPDGSCLFAAELENDTIHLRAYHWSNFGSTNGISLELQGLPMASRIITSIGSRSKAYYVGLDVEGSRCKSFALDISRRVTEFTFQERGTGALRERSSRSTFCNSLIDCHSDVWTRFPVVPAVRRTTANIVTGNPRSLLFVSPLEPTLIQTHFTELIATFERVTRKPTESELSNIVVRGITYEAFKKSDHLEISTYKCGEWLVNLLCLIPIHVAVARDNRFIPLKDGVWSLELERSLLGATVEHIVDALSFGWYESIFQSYMASKPVRVVSSMGEQSVGKSFALNHLVDTSFAGSAMRTTEGVWMSVTPTDDSLIVALDFEGVHSIERSAQEDSLLVLFNTAMSNLVLFRNNFALSRDITSLFQSFQSSSTVLDPASNPTLFKSTLVIIIKDVVDSDKKEITKEFSLKFQKIVELEQESNFITKLHGGNLAIIPWPVIESRKFYTLFPALKKMLDRQTVTHSSAGIFLQTMKTLMAKLKVNDWGSLDQNLSSHRAHQLISLLPKALMYGAMELEPELEPLRDFDSGFIVDKPDSDAKFYLIDSKASADSKEQERVFAILLATWDKFGQRSNMTEDTWMEELETYLDHLASNRIAHVQEWLQVNTVRFRPDSLQFEDVRRLYDSYVISLRGSIRLCALHCAECHLSCLRPKHHDGDHDCQTNHSCIHSCQYEEEHDSSPESCGLPAGHVGTHICDISAHLCGLPCHLRGKGGCLERCSKPVNHIDDEHVCPASHECAEPCSLVDVRLSDGSLFSCPEICHKPSHEAHETHICENRSCPIRCQLCKRLCASPEHLHALDPNAVHLCGQEHPCPKSCQSPGICRIETAPQSIEATFTGRHETFQYTKYTQVSRRLPCVIPIPADQLEHEGAHLHSLEQSVFHFCETRCEDCGYFCMLPLGHNQQEHETSHGSMSRTKWAIDGQDGTVLEVNGRKFGVTDDGAPMLCSMVCRNMGRHVHIDTCRSENSRLCNGSDVEHITARIMPHPERPKDFISHALHWRRSGFKDPYSQEERSSFSKCDSMCSGPEHQADASGPAQPSYCNLDLFHRPLPVDQAPPGGVGYISRDGHHFSCRNPAQMQQAFHVIFVIDRSGSMGGNDRRPLPNTPVTAQIASRHNNRVGSVYSSLHGFWQARASALNSTARNALPRRDSYTVILFDSYIHKAAENDFTSTPDQLLNAILPYGPGGGTNYSLALRETQTVLENYWSPERTPVVIFLSDGECNITSETIRSLCRRSVALGRPLSFHTVAFGPYNPTLQMMARVASEVQSTAPADPMHPTVPSSYTETLDTVRLAETFLGLAESLRKPRGALMRA